MKSTIDFAVTVGGVLSLTAVMATLPAPHDSAHNSAQAQARLEGSAMSMTAANVITTVSGALTLPPGLFFTGTNVEVIPTYGTGARVDSIRLNFPSIDKIPVDVSFSRAAAEVLTDIANGSSSLINNVEALSAIIRAGAGADGLD